MSAPGLAIPSRAVASGVLGVTLCPGRTVGARSHGPRSLSDDLDAIVAAGYTHVGVLLCDDEIASFAPKLLEGYAARGITAHRYPIVDVRVPRSMSTFAEYVARLRELLHGGAHVLVHCRGGLGRAGLVAACLLVGEEIAPPEAIEQVRKLRPGSIETPEQEAFVAAFASAWHTRQATLGSMLGLRLNR